MWIGTLGIVAIVGALVWPTRPRPAPPPRESEAISGASVVGPRLLAITPQSPLAKKITLVTVTSEQVSSALLTVTGAVVARHHPSDANTGNRWDFSGPEVSSVYADWLRARHDTEFTAKQLAKTRELAAAKVARADEVLARLQKLVSLGTDSERDLAAARADRLQAQLESDKAVYDVESAWRLASKNEQAAERQLLQAGLDPAVIEVAPDSTAIVAAQVPEAKVAVVHERQACEARFYGIPGATFRGRVARLAPALSAERRTLRVLFELPDAGARIRPGMFADIGLGTDPRAALFVPAEAVIHVGRGEYVLARAEAGKWRVTEIQVGDQRGDQIEVLQGLAPGDQVIGSGAVLLKPFIVDALQG